MFGAGPIGNDNPVRVRVSFRRTRKGVLEKSAKTKGPDKRSTEIEREVATTNDYEFYENMHMQCT